MRTTIILSLAVLTGALSGLMARARAAPLAGRTAELGRYQLEKGPFKMPEVEENGSGLTCELESGTIYAIANKPARIFELGPDGKPSRTIELRGFDDTEDLAALGGQRFAVVEEKRRDLCLFRLAAEATAVDYAAAEKVRVVQEPPDNVGLEGLTYDPKGQRFWVVKEKEPRAIYEVKLGATAAQRKVTRPWNLETHNFGCTDFSGVCFDARTGHLLLLSDESKCVVEVTLDGQELGRLSLKAGSAGLTADLPQPEGITLDREGRLYICSEPDWLYVFSQRP
jgi:uncharacterized protein YjiK